MLEELKYALAGIGLAYLITVVIFRAAFVAWLSSQFKRKYRDDNKR